MLSGLKIVDLFSGCGGLTEGAMRAARAAGRGMEVALAVDVDSSAMKVYETNFRNPRGRLICAGVEEIFDVSSGSRKLSGEELKFASDFSDIDIVVAGPPCQGHSSLNNFSRGSDPRNLLYWAPVRAAIAMRPKVLLVENVPGVTASQEQVIEGARASLTKSGYFVSECTMNLSEVGVPQQRKRHVLLATESRFDIRDLIASRRLSGSREVLDAIADIADLAAIDGNPFDRTTRLSKDNLARINYLFDHNLYDLPNSMRPPCHRDKSHSYVSMYGRMRPDRPAQTITGGFGSMGQGRFVHPTRRRMITAHEAARLQGFDDTFDFSSAPDMSSLRKMIGNAAPPALSEIVLRGLIERGHL